MLLLRSAFFSSYLWPAASICFSENGDSNVELRGPARNRELGRDYICFLLLNKKNEPLELDPEDREDCSWIDVGHDGFIHRSVEATTRCLKTP